MALTTFDKFSRNIFIGFLILMCAYLIHIGVLPFVNPDTTQYVHESAFRSPGYPWFLHIDMGILGAHNFSLTFALQLILGVVSSIYAGSKLRKLLNLPHYMSYLFSIIFLIPYFFGDYKFANRLLSEGICYPLYLFGFSNLLIGLTEKRVKNFYIFFVCLFLMVLTRPQMIFLYPISAVAVLYACVFFKNKTSIKVMLILTLLATIIGANITDRAYHYFKHGHFAKEPVFGFSLVVAPLYLSHASDAKLIHDPINRKLFLEIHKTIVTKHASNETYNISRAENTFDHYAGSYNVITWDSMHPIFAKSGINNWYEMNRRAEQIAWPLLKAHWKGYLELWFYAVKEKLGGYYGSLFCILILILSFFIHLKRKDQLSLILFFTVLTSFANYTSVALVEIILRRYSSYTESFQLCVLLGLVFLILSVKTTKAQESNQVAR
jgi:hypothetical protein